MYGLEAISANNGWAMALLGITIVFSGLAFLSFFISRLHLFLEFWENKDERIAKLKKRFQKKPEIKKEAPVVKVPDNLQEAMAQFKMLTTRIGDPFSLPRLIEMAEMSGLFHPHSTVNKFIKAGVIEPDGKGFFTWKL
ncbi:MAG: OadG family protein [Desulfobacterales bacterium]|nr:OadG family protein [Desulfobacterales bacterium]